MRLSVIVPLIALFFAIQQVKAHEHPKAATQGKGATAQEALNKDNVVPEADSNHAEKIDVVFVLDTTGSMGGLIKGAKQKIWFIANAMATSDPAPKIRMGLVGYRDRGDKYVTKQTELTHDLDSVYTELMSFQADGGGDAPESVNQALHEAITSQPWSSGDGVYRVVFLVGDCPPHMDYQDDVKYPLTCKQAIENDVIINTIQCGTAGGTQSIWQEIAELANGKYFRVEQSGGAIVTETPHDGELTRLSKELDATRIYYGSHQQQAEQQERKEKAKIIYSRGSQTANAQRSVFNSSKAGYDNFVGSQELVSQIKAGQIKLADIKAEELPKEMQSMTLEQQTQYVEQKSAERIKLQKQVAQLAVKRNAYIQKQTELLGKEADAGFDSAVVRSVKEQSKSKSE